MICETTPKKTSQYSPCNSAFADIFVPFGITKAYVAGHMSFEAKKEWEDPRINKMRMVHSPRGVLIESGAFDRLNITQADKNTASSQPEADKQHATPSLESNNSWQVVISN